MVRKPPQTIGELLRRALPSAPIEGGWDRQIWPVHVEYDSVPAFAVKLLHGIFSRCIKSILVLGPLL